MTGTVHRRFNPIDLLRKMGWPHNHITFAPDIAFQYRIMRHVRHLGAPVSTRQILAHTLLPLASKASFFKPEAPEDWRAVTDIHYAVGWLDLFTLSIPFDWSSDGNTEGFEDRTLIPVKANLLDSGLRRKHPQPLNIPVQYLEGEGEAA
jgi:hypothetical protein